MNKIVIIKLGGSLITDKSKVDTARLNVIDDLSIQIKKAIIDNKDTSYIIATGAGGYGHPVAKRYQNNLKKGLVPIKNAVKKINNIVVSSFQKIGLKAISVEPSQISTYKNGKIVSVSLSEIFSLLERGVIPVMHADLTCDIEKGISILSMDKFLVDLAISIKNSGKDVENVIFCGTTNGVLDKDGKTINKITTPDLSQINALFFDNKMIDTSGGMKGKVIECLRLIKEKIPCIFVNGLDKDILLKSIEGGEVTGTKFSNY
jgi:isopentenyl phosphate kinase